MTHILDAIRNGHLFALSGTDKTDALTFLARNLGAASVEEVFRREAEFNTGLGEGIAVPHVRADGTDDLIRCAVGWSAAGIDYDAQDGAPVYLVVMYYIPDSQKNAYLKEIAGLFKALVKNGGIAPIADATDLGTVGEILLSWAK
ncbi:MAG: PTS sugar transporter subunit IIA [Puniceicoccales bacterium]|jgi:mannitol/fructose-specific phosphotransferase system IIA component (Ntr-type)|nr:PTS sugar transporter subunit IIA [Puniceicoccales bacterium]